MRLIDADRLKAVLDKNFGNIGGAAVLAQMIDNAPTVDAVAVDKLKIAMCDAESVRDSIVGGSQLAPYMYAYLCLKESLEKLIGCEDGEG